MTVRFENVIVFDKRNISLHFKKIHKLRLINYTNRIKIFTKSFSEISFRAHKRYFSKATEEAFYFLSKYCDACIFT